MTEQRICDECGKHLITQRRGARFCGDECKNAWHNKHRRSQSSTSKRLEAAEGGVGTRGGSVRSVDEARQLQTASKALDRWRLVMEQQILHTLLGTGRFHIDDLDCLGLPAEAFKVRGTLVSSVRRSGVMASTNVYRKVSHKAANGRPAPIYEITAQGRAEIPRLLRDLQSELPKLGIAGLDPPNPEGSAATEVESHSGAAPSTGHVAPVGDVPHGAGSSGSVEPGDLTPASASTLKRKEQPSPPGVAAADAGSPDHCTKAGPSTGGNGDKGAPDSSSSAGDGALFEVESGCSAYQAWEDAA